MRKVALAAAIALLVSLPAVSAAWPSFRGDERNTGFQAGTAFQLYEDVWWNLKLKPATQVEASPVVKDGVAIVVGWDHVIRALDAESGKSKWNATTKSTAKYVGTPAIVASRVFTVDSAGKLESRDLQKGTLLGSTTVGPTLASLAVHEGKLFIGNEAGEMKAFDTETLTLLWNFKITDHSDTTATSGTGASAKTVCGEKFKGGVQIRGAPAIFGGRVIFGSLNHWVFAVNEQGNPGLTTDLRWMFETGDSIFGAPAIDSATGRVIVGSYDEKVYALPVAGGTTMLVDGKPCTASKQTPAWTFNVPSDIGQSKVHSSPAIDGTRVYFGANNGHVYAITLAAGAKAWEFATGGAVISSPVVSNGVVVVGSDDGNMYWLRSNNGTQLKAYQVDSPVKASPAIDGNRTLVVSFEGSVYMFGPKVPLRPDLVVSSIVYNQGTIAITVRNAGTGPSTPTTLRIQVDGSRIADLPVSALEAGLSVILRQTTSLTEGKHTLAAAIDGDNTVKESNESNNENTSSTTVAAPPKGSPAPMAVLVGLLLLGLASRSRSRP